MPIPINPSEAEFVAACKSTGGGGTIPLIFRMPNDRLFALSVFENMQRKSEHAFFLESVETGEKIGRYSFMGVRPRFIAAYRGGEFTVTDSSGRIAEKSKGGGDPLLHLQNFMSRFSSPPICGLPPFLGGAVGYLGYDCVHYFEPVGGIKKDEIGTPEMLWMIADSVVIFDHLKSQIYLVKNCPSDGNAAAAYRDGKRDLARLVDDYFNSDDARRVSLDDCASEKSQDASPLLPSSNFTREEYYDVVLRAKEYIRRGDIFQVVPSQRFYPTLNSSPFEVYRRLRQLNPSPYMFYLKCADLIACGSSPELMVSCRDGKLKLRPIAGTRRRGADENEDERLAEELLADEKECAEHLMLVDLGRNDLGRVARPGTVKIAPGKFKVVERYSHVMHIASEIAAELSPPQTAYDAARATFPAGTLTGAPKVRAMQIINEMEPSRRGIYGGLVGYFGFDGNCSSCIAIRMLTVNRGRAYVQAGGGLVADSSPPDEYQETINKAMAVLRAIEAAEKK